MCKIVKKLYSTPAILTVLAAVVGSSLAAAQMREGEGFSVLEEILVTATRRSENIQDVGIAITAMSGDQIEALGFTNAQQVAAFAPGVSTVQPNGESNYSVAIRGVSNSDFVSNVESPVALYLDEVYISQASGSGFMLFDMERVEILRGPQGTLFGRNATGGLVHFISRKPEFDFDGYGKLTFGEYDQFKYEGAVGGPLGEYAAFRVSISAHENGGYVRNRAPNADNLNNADDLSLRTQLLVAPSNNFDVLLSYRHASQDIDTGFFEYVSSSGGRLTPGAPNPALDGYSDNDGDPFTGNYDDPGFNELEVEGYSATVKWALTDEINLTSITDFSTTKRDYIEDTDASPVTLFNFFLITDAEQLSQEVRFDYQDDQWGVVAGVYYLNLDINDNNGGITEALISTPEAAGGFGLPSASPGAEQGLHAAYTSELTSISVFGQVEYSPSEQVDVIAGLRIINDQKDYDYRLAVVEFADPRSRPGFNAPGNLTEVLELGTYNSDRDDTEFAFRLQLNWRPNDGDSLFYASYNRGVKGGGFNSPIFPPSAEGTGFDDDTFSYGPEQLDAYEIGFKTRVGDIGWLNLAAYYYDYKDYQLFETVQVDTFTFNGEGESRGFEAELQIIPADNWDVLLGVGYIDVEATTRLGVETTPVQTPEINFNGLVRYNTPLPGGELVFQLSMDYRDEHFFALTGTPAVTQDSYTVVNYLATLALGRWQLSAFVNNLFDEEYLVQAFDLSDAFGLTEQYYGRPRWWGVSIQLDF